MKKAKHLLGLIIVCALLTTTHANHLANKDITNTGATLTSKGAMTLSAENINIDTLKDKRAYDYKFSNGYAKGNSVKHIQSTIDAGGQLSALATKDVNLEAVQIKAGDTYIKSKNKVNITAVVDSKYTESHFEDSGFLSSSSVTDMSLAQEVKSTDIQTTNLVIDGKKGVTLESMTATASNSAQITSQAGAVDFVAKEYTNASFHEETSSFLGGLFSERTVDSISETLLADSSTKATNQIIVQGKNINITATDITTERGNIFLTADEKVSIKAGMESRTEQHIKEKSGLFQGGHLWQMKKDETATYDETAKASNVIAGTANIPPPTATEDAGNMADSEEYVSSSVIINAGSAELIGSNIIASDHIIVDTDVGSIVVKEAKEQHGKKEVHEELNIDLTLKASTSNGKAKLTIATAEYDKTELDEQSTTSASSSLQAGGTVQLTSVEDIKIQGSNLSAGGDVNLDAQGDILITEAKDTTDTTIDETHIEAELSLSVSHSAVYAGYAIKAVNTAKNQVKQANRDYRQYKKDLKKHETTLETLKQELAEGKPGVAQEDINELTELIADSKEDEKYYVASIASATANLVSKTTQAAQSTAGAAQSLGTAGINVGLDLDIDGTKTHTDSTSTQSTASTITAGNNINLTTATGDTQQVLIQGSHLASGESINIETETLNIKASQDTYSTNTDSTHINAHASLSLTSGNYSASLSGDESTSAQSGTQHTNSSLNANNINITTTKDTNIIGANIHATELTTLNIGGDLNIASVRDKTKSNSHSAGASIGISGGDGGVSGANAGVNTANSRSTTKQTVLTSLTGAKVVINTTGNTDIKGALVSSGEIDEDGKFIDNKELTLNTGTLTHSDLSNTSYSTSTSASISVGDSTTQVGYENSTTNTKTKTLATLGEGTVTIAGEETGTDSTLNRDTDNIDKDIYDVTQQKGNVNLTVDNRILTEDGRTEIKEDFKRTEILVESVVDVATNDGVSLVGDQANGETGLLDHIDEDQKYFTATKNFVNDPANQANVEALNNPNATPEQKQEAYSSLASHISQEMGVSPAEAKLMIDSQYSGAFHKDGEAGTIYVNDLAQADSADAVNTVGHETQHSIDYQNDKDIDKTDNYESNREDHAELMGDHTEDYMEYQYADNGYDSLSATQNNNVGTNVFNGHGVSETVKTNTENFNRIDPSKLDALCINNNGCYGDATKNQLLSGAQGTIGKVGNYILDGISQDNGQTFVGYVMVNPETGNTITIRPEELASVQYMAETDPDKFKNYMAVAEMQANSTHTSNNAANGLHDDGYLGGVADAWGQYATSGDMFLDMVGGGAGKLGGFGKVGNKIPKPIGIPTNWIVKPSKKNDGVRYINPNNTHDSVRIMPGNPNSPHPSQQVPYVKRGTPEGYRDINGNIVNHKSSEAHIPLADFKF